MSAVTRSSLTELPDVPARVRSPPRALGNDADRAVPLEIRRADLRKVVDPVLAGSHLDLVGIDVLVAHGLLDDLPVLHEQGRLALEEMLDERDAVTDAREDEIHGDERRGGDDAADERVIAAGHRVLDGVRDDEDDHEVDRAHLPELPLARGP